MTGQVRQIALAFSIRSRSPVMPFPAFGPPGLSGGKNKSSPVSSNIPRHAAVSCHVKSLGINSGRSHLLTPLIICQQKRQTQRCCGSAYTQQHRDVQQRTESNRYVTHCYVRVRSVLTIHPKAGKLEVCYTSEPMVLSHQDAPQAERYST